ncbi:MAG: cyclic nucleotide-binding domain-containing protein [Immundisolibacter sp.]|uniref:cyclic nucleotide-binding domain-containing protein n=1 Tax=Immundisolibacter sp. TaxID=1934948 RepID=UPI003EE2E81A
MNLRELVDSQRFCQGLTPGQCTGLAACASERSFAPGDYLLRQHAVADTFYLVLSGEVQIRLAVPGQGVVTLETIGPDEAVGWSWFVPPHRCQFDAHAVLPTRTLAFAAAPLRALMEQDPTVGYAVLKTLVGTLTQRVQSCRLQVLDVYAPPGA